MSHIILNLQAKQFDRICTHHVTNLAVFCLIILKNQEESILDKIYMFVFSLLLTLNNICFDEYCAIEDRDFCKHPRRPTCGLIESLE